MDGSRFDDLTRRFARGGLTRRRFLKSTVGGLVAGSAGAAAAVLPEPDVAEAACKPLGRTCLVGRQCCSGTCVLVGLPPLRLLQCGCPPGTENCQGECKGAADFQFDPQHCGGCGHACAADEVCIDGDCQCPAGTVPCGGQCVPACSPGQVVDPATCACVCEAGGPLCGAGGEICCEPGQGCEGGACCAGSQQHCADRLCCAGQSCERSGGEPDFTCRGQPGFPCASDVDCSNLSSGPCCDGVCVSARDTTNCGACGLTCDLANPDERCLHGECCLDFGAACDPTGGTPCCGLNNPSPHRCGNDSGEPICCGTTGALCDPDAPHVCCSGVCEDAGSIGFLCV